MLDALPAFVQAYKRTATFTEATLPAGLQGRHNTREGVWARIHVVRGEVLYRILEPAIEEHLLTPARDGLVEPTVPHQLELRGPVDLFVEFFRRE
ncbi:MAG: DUF1971 domain-containing protein [Myxococcales bacterium]|nr:DUF1971 domain-containing protein [Myxococcales bacterium]